ncbi:hypothetical protein BDZ89DRAFT_118156 [Hymenopellis radicata]|nr:hypothetical protein BDZ89DRAFT_118156 [Hymenopellis radicata]
MTVLMRRSDGVVLVWKIDGVELEGWLDVRGLCGSESTKLCIILSRLSVGRAPPRLGRGHLSDPVIRSGGLKGRLRRALSFNAAQALKEEEDDDDDVSIKASQSKKPKTPILIDSAVQKPGGGIRSPDSGGDDASTRAPSTVQTKKRGRAASLFSSRLNASTDNISLSSTVSSAYYDYGCM